MSLFKVQSIVISSDDTNSTVIVNAPGNDFTRESFITISNCDVSVLNGTFRITAIDGDLFSFLIPIAYLPTPTFDGIYVESLSELTISPKVFSENQIDMAYMYGISDFWSSVFEGTDKVDLMLESLALQSSDVYSHFLQLTTTISLSEIQTTVNSQLRNIVLSSNDLVPGTEATYYLPEKILGCSFIMNRPFLPSLTLEDGTHYSINASGTEISMFEKLETLNFPVRKSATTGYNEFSLWLTDVKIDEQLISKYYGKLIGANEQTSTEKFKNYIYGLFYLYTHGPNLAQVRKGLNLTLGLPLARDYETVLDIRQYLETNQYVVITDYNQYLVPYGIAPSVSVGDYLTPSQEIAQWVEIKDWVSDGKWWINLHIPEQVLPYLPDGQADRYAKDGSYADQLMTEYLKNNTFLVNVNVTSFKDIQNFQELYDILYNVKPTHTFPLYIWTVPIEEPLPLEDELTTLNYMNEWCENLSVPITRMKRGLEDTDLYLKRGCPQFVRFNVSNYVAEISGGDSSINGEPRNVNGGTVSGFINYRKQYEGDRQTNEDKAWIRTLFSRCERTQRWKKGLIKFNSAPSYDDNSGVVSLGFADINPTMRVIPLYITTSNEIQVKFDVLGLGKVDSNVWSYDVFKPTRMSPYINQVAINDGRNVDYSVAVKSNFNTLFTRTVPKIKPNNFIPPAAFSYTYTTATVSDIYPYDYIVIRKIYGSTYGVYWVTNNPVIDAPPYVVSKESDQLSLSITGSKISRGMGPLGTPYYLLRGAGLVVETKIDPINKNVVNGSLRGTSSVSPNYSDALNTIQVMDRSGKLINIRKDLL